MNIVIAGGRGFLGQILSTRLIADGHRVLTLTRGRAAPGRRWQQTLAEQTWTPDGTAGGWASAIDGSDVVVNFAGASIGEGRWSAARKKAIFESRILSTRSLATAIDQAARPPAVLVNASGQGYYGDRGDEELTEASPPGSDFLAGVCREWEREALRAATRSRVLLLRTGLVLTAAGGVLPRMLQPFRLFAGGPFGSGRQFMSWIHLADWLEIVRLAILDERASGPRNLGSPHPVRNREFATALGRAIGRPSFMPAPAFALRIAVGEMATPLLLASTRMVPAAVLSEGYRFAFPELRAALEDILT